MSRVSLDNFRPSLSWRHLLLALGVGAIVYVLAWFGIELTRSSGRIAAVWLSNAVLLAVVLKRPTEQWAAILLLAFAGNVLANLQSGDSLLIAGLLSGCNVVEVLVAATCFLAFSDSRDFRRQKPMLVLLLCSAGPATLVSSSLASFALAQVAGADFFSVFVTWYPADTLGLITLAPLLLVLDRDDFSDLVHPAVLRKLALMLVVVVAAVAAIFLQRSMPLLFLAFPALLVAVWLLGYVGGAIGVAIIAVAAFIATLNDFGPISLMQADHRLSILALQLFTATAALTGIMVASVLFEVSMLRAALAQAPDFFYVKNRRSEFVAVNRRVAEIAGQDSVDRMIGRTDFDFVAPARASSLLAEEREVMASGFPLKDKLENVGDTAGGFKWFETTKVPLKAQTGRVIGLAGTTKDITQRKALEDAVVRGRDQLALVLREMSDGLAVISDDGYIVMCNEQFQRLFPLTGPMRVQGAYFPRVLQAARELGEQPDLDPSEAMSKLRQGLDNEIHLSNGEILHARSSPGSRGGWVIVVSDITRIKRAELEIRAMAEQLEVLASTDGLTGVVNRRTMDERLEREVARCRRTRSPIAVVMVDIDHFKAFNDTYGHQAGDQCLRRVAKVLEGGLNRPGDFVARYGGEEFCLVLPETDEAGAFVLAERLRLAVRELNIANAKAEGGVITISSGVAYFVHDGSATTAAELISRADHSLYASKHLGRDRVTGWSFANSEAMRGKLSAAS